MEIGFTEILMIAVIALLFFGPSKLPQMGRALGDTIRGFKKGMNDIQENMDAKSQPPPPRSEEPQQQADYAQKPKSKEPVDS